MLTSGDVAIADLSTHRLGEPSGTVGPAVLGQMQETIADLLDL